MLHTKSYLRFGRNQRSARPSQGGRFADPVVPEQRPTSEAERNLPSVKLTEPRAVFFEKCVAEPAPKPEPKIDPATAARLKALAAKAEVKSVFKFKVGDVLEKKGVGNCAVAVKELYIRDGRPAYIVSYPDERVSATFDAVFIEETFALKKTESTFDHHARHGLQVFVHDLVDGERFRFNPSHEGGSLFERVDKDTIRGVKSGVKYSIDGYDRQRALLRPEPGEES